MEESNCCWEGWREGFMLRQECRDVAGEESRRFKRMDEGNESTKVSARCS
jgi:hypothetical protein